MTDKVRVSGNVHYMDKSACYEHGEFPDYDAAIEASRKMVDEYVLSAYQSGVTAHALLASDLSFGEDPYIVALAP